MGGSLAGHGAAWPLPTVISAALHSALHRAEFSEADAHAHRVKRDGEYQNDQDGRNRKFGSLVTAGPFPVCQGKWFFPRPLDAGSDQPAATFQPLATPGNSESTYGWGSLSSLPKPLAYVVANTAPPSKKTPSPWWSASAWEAYLNGTDLLETKKTEVPHFRKDTDFSDQESSFGIGIDPTTGTQDGVNFYSAHYLRLRENCQMGVLATASDKNHQQHDRDLIKTIFPNSGARTAIIAGGQQRICTVMRESDSSIPLPRGKSAGFAEHNGKFLVKWVLLSPAIFPAVTGEKSKRGRERKTHPGGWLPSWIDCENGKVLLQTITPEERKRRRSLNAGNKGYESHPNIAARLVAATIGKPVPVTGYTPHHHTAHPQLQDNGSAIPDHAEHTGPKTVHFAVPPGSIYYFECDDQDTAEKLAAVLNWHAKESNGVHIANRRSTLLGEKGFGLGVCGTWQFHNGNRPS